MVVVPYDYTLKKSIILDITLRHLPNYAEPFIQESKISRNCGLAIYLHNDFKGRKRNPLCVIEQEWEALFIDVTADLFKKPITIGNIYRGHHNNSEQIKKFMDGLSSTISKLGTPSKYQILAGDFNLDFLRIHTDNTVSDCFELLISNSFFPHVTLPTRVAEKTNSQTQEKTHTITLIDHI